MVFGLNLGRLKGSIPFRVTLIKSPLRKHRAVKGSAFRFVIDLLLKGAVHPTSVAMFYQFQGSEMDLTLKE